MVSTKEEITDDSPSLPMIQTIVKKTSSWKSLRLFTNMFYGINRNAIRRVGAAKSKRRAIKYGCSQ